MATTQQAFKCPKCGAELKMVVSGKAHFYGSPIRQCAKCAQVYVDRNYHEIEIEGIRAEDLSAKKSLGLTLFCLIGLVVCIGGWILLSNSSGFIVKSPAPFIVGILLFGIGFIAMIGDTLKILTGAKKKQLEKEREASAQRLSDRAYVQKLQKLGYEIPEKYLQE